MPLTALEAELRERAREKIAHGELPCALPTEVWGGPGADAPCALCEKPITAQDVAYEVIVNQRSTQFHIFCHSSWQLECARFLALKNLERASPRLEAHLR